MMSSEFVFVYTTVADQSAADALAAPLVAQRLAACVNCVPGIVSHYEWQGRCERSSEVALWIKTRRSLVEAVLADLGQRHPYQTPALAVIPIDRLGEPYRRWALAQTEDGGKAQGASGSPLS